MSTFKNILVKAFIQSTSNKIDESNKQETPTKTLYISVPNKKDITRLTDFGLTLYSSREDNSEFFIIKGAEKVKVYDTEGNIVERKLTTDLPNFTSNDKLVGLNITHITPDKKNHNPFFRITAIKVSDYDDLAEIESKNPFEDFDF